MDLILIIVLILLLLTSALVYYAVIPASVTIRDPPIIKLAQGSPINLVTPATIDLNAPKTIEMVTPSHIPLKAEPLLVNYGNAPQLQVADIPLLRFEKPDPILIRNNPCEGMSDQFRGVGAACARFIWQDCGCVDGGRKYGDWESQRTKKELYDDSKLWSLLQSTHHRTGCYGPKYDEFVQNAPEVFCVTTPDGYKPRSFWNSLLAEKGWKLATREQLAEAQKAGAQWCAAAFLADGKLAFPMKEGRMGCGNVTGIVDWGGEVGAINVFASKPSPIRAKTSQYIILPFHENGTWSRWDV